MEGIRMIDLNKVNFEYNMPTEGEHVAKIVKIDLDNLTDNIIIELLIDNGEFTKKLFLDVRQNMSKIIARKLLEVLGYQGNFEFEDTFDLTSTLSAFGLSKLIMVEVKHYKKKDGKMTYIITDIKPAIVKPSVRPTEKVEEVTVDDLADENDDDETVPF